MKRMTGLWIVCVAAVLLVSGCDRLPGAGSSTLVVDLAAVAKATGQEEAMQAQAQAAREEINAQLGEAGRKLEQQIQQERDKFGDSPTQEQELQLQQMALQAQQQFGQLQAEAQQQSQQFEVNLVLEFREAVKPFAEKIARSQGGGIVLLADQTVFWLDPDIDLTSEIIAAVRAEGVFSDTNSDASSEVPVKDGQ